MAPSIFASVRVKESNGVGEEQSGAYLSKDSVIDEYMSIMREQL